MATASGRTGGGAAESSRHPGERVSETVIRTLTAAGLDTTDPNVVLYDVLDLEALDALFSIPVESGTPTEQLVVEFRVFGYRVTVYGGTDVRVRAVSLED
jgi:hypothetical protein